MVIEVNSGQFRNKNEQTLGTCIISANKQHPLHLKTENSLIAEAVFRALITLKSAILPKIRFHFQSRSVRASTFKTFYSQMKYRSVHENFAKLQKTFFQPKIPNVGSIISKVLALNVLFFSFSIISIRDEFSAHGRSITTLFKVLWALIKYAFTVVVVTCYKAHSTCLIRAKAALTATRITAARGRVEKFRRC